MLRHELVSFYRSNAGTHNYMIVYSYVNRMFIACIDDKRTDFLERATRVDRMSSKRGGWATLRMARKNELIDVIESCAHEIIDMKMNLDEFEELAKNSQYTGSKQVNRGNAAERWITEELAGQTWVKDSISFDKQGDVVVNGIDYQVKFENATFTTERAMARA